MATMLEKLGFQPLVEETLTSKRIHAGHEHVSVRAGVWCWPLRGVSSAEPVAFLAAGTDADGHSEGHPAAAAMHLLAVSGFAASACRTALLNMQRRMRERVWEAAHVKLAVVTLDTDTTVHTLFGQQMGGRKSYNPKNKGKKSYQPMLTFLAETREYVWGELRNGDRPSGEQIARSSGNVQKALPPGVKTIYGRADSGFYCREAVEAYEESGAQFMISARKTSRLVEELKPSGRRHPRPTPTGMRISLSAGGLEQALSFPRPAQRKATRGTGSRGTRAIPVVRYQPSTTIGSSSPI